MYSAASRSPALPGARFFMFLQMWVIPRSMPSTDALLVGETQEQFEARLREQYSPQIMLYREILQRIGLGEVKEMYLCAIALHGAMIHLGL